MKLIPVFRSTEPQTPFAEVSEAGCQQEKEVVESKRLSFQLIYAT